MLELCHLSIGPRFLRRIKEIYAGALPPANRIMVLASSTAHADGAALMTTAAAIPQPTQK
jgi:hypothetical protein